MTPTHREPGPPPPDNTPNSGADPASSASPEMTVRLHPSGRTLAARPDQTLWTALEAAGEMWPVSCRNGSCRTCIGRLLSGQVRYTIPWPGLLPEEKASGHVLPCVACPVTSVVLTGPGD
jgi:ferredoxin